jgi:hypothetical protein
MNCSDARKAVDSVLRRSEIAPHADQHLINCAPCREYAAGNFSLIAMLASQPVVEAPPDFDFRLRASIARARDERRGLKWTLGQLWQRSFSWKPATAAAGLVFALVTSTTLYFSRGSETTSAPGSTIASIAQPPAGVTAGQPPTFEVIRVPETRHEPPAVKRAYNGMERPAANGPALVPMPAAERTIARVSEPLELQGTQEILVYQPGQSGRPGAARSVVLPRRGQVLWGAQLAGMKEAAATRTTPSAVETF